ncbi:hypothetical protein [Vibrio gazogenes]|uniref:Uncharacterized protein n=1 Tax=Vibrio gazogenes TaxID=687 RepID=A0A1Z2SL05_VIBGA|nr:hypothetical protein [Vibrio gazogenes]ASA57871.1 hypothetical protein BSQ33_19315 [Vibrio gazogenes]ASA58216.1 hypothetical protein BSQ33_21280 [Vibrio gazogenes]
MIEDLKFLIKCLERISDSKDIDTKNLKLEIEDCFHDIEVLKERVSGLAGAIECKEELSTLSALMLVGMSIQDLCTAFSNITDELNPVAVDSRWADFPETEQYETESKREYYCKVGEKVREKWSGKCR